MKSTRAYTNATFTKRVVHEGGLHHENAGMPEPTVCVACGAIYVNRRWTSRGPTYKAVKHGHLRPANSTTCPACVQAHNRIGGGYLTVDGEFFREHKAEIGRLLKNEAERARKDNPLSRTIARSEADGKLVITTTTEHLAQRLGRALEKAYDGEVSYDFSHENKVARVHWHRDEL